MLTEHDVEQRFRARAELGSAEDGLALLEELGAYDKAHGSIDEVDYPQPG